MLLNVLRVTARRWYLVLVGLLLTAGLAFGAMQATPSEFRSRALILLLPSEEVVGAGGNPLLALSGLEQPASLVAAHFASAGAREEVAARSATANYLVAIDGGTRGPVILVDVTDATAAQSLATLDYLIERIPEELRRLQDEVQATEDSMIGSMVLTEDSEAVEDDSATTRMVIAALAVGLAGTVFLAFGIDGLLARRSTRRAKDSPDPDRQPVDAHASDLVEHPREVDATRESTATSVVERPRSRQHSPSR